MERFQPVTMKQKTVDIIRNNQGFNMCLAGFLQTAYKIRMVRDDSAVISSRPLGIACERRSDSSDF
jgi:hypothetical protein